MAGSMDACLSELEGLPIFVLETIFSLLPEHTDQESFRASSRYLCSVAEGLIVMLDMDEAEVPLVLDPFDALRRFPKKAKLRTLAIRPEPEKDTFGTFTGSVLMDAGSKRAMHSIEALRLMDCSVSLSGAKLLGAGAVCMHA